MKQITLTLSTRFHEWCRENPDEIMAKSIPKDAKTIMLEMSDDAFESLLDRKRKEGGSLAEWLISSDDFITDIQISAGVDAEDDKEKARVPILVCRAH